MKEEKLDKLFKDGRFIEAFIKINFPDYFIKNENLFNGNFCDDIESCNRCPLKTVECIHLTEEDDLIGLINEQQKTYELEGFNRKLTKYVKENPKSLF